MSTIPHLPRDSQSSLIKPGTRKRLAACLTLQQRMTLHTSTGLFLESLSLKNGFAACKLRNHEAFGRSINGVWQKCIIFNTHKFISARLKLYLEPVMENAGLHLLGTCQ